MTSMHNGPVGNVGSRAADSAGCLLVVGGYRNDADVFEQIVEIAQKRLLMSPSLGDFFELRFVDLGPRPAESADNSAQVARLFLELTSRPGEAARNFSALLVIDPHAAIVDRLLRACQASRHLSDLRVRFHGIALTDDRPRFARGQDERNRSEITISPGGDRGAEELVAQIQRYAESLLGEFSSEREQGLPARRLDELAATAESELREVVAAAMKVDVEARRTELEKEAERRETQRKETERREAERKKDLERRRQAPELKEAQLRQALPGKAVEEKAAEPERTAEAENAAADQQSAKIAESKRLPGDKDEKDEKDEKERLAEAYQPTTPSSEDSQAGSWRAIGGRVASRLPWVRYEPAPGASRGAESDTGVTLLRDCVARLRAEDRKGFEAYLAALCTYAGSEISDEQHRHYQLVVIQDQLLRPGLPLGSADVRFYDVVLRLAYGLPLGYADYCQVEDLVARADKSGQLPQRPLLEAIDGGGITDVRVATITCQYLGDDRLTAWLRSGQVCVGSLIAALDSKWERPVHADILYAAAIQYLGLTRGIHEQQEVRDELRAHGFLAAALRERFPQSVRDQRVVLTAFLRAAYPAGLDRQAVMDIIGASTLTTALLTAVLPEIADPADARWTIQIFAERSDAKAFNAAEEAIIIRQLTSGQDG